MSKTNHVIVLDSKYIQHFTFIILRLFEHIALIMVFDECYFGNVVFCKRVGCLGLKLTEKVYTP